MADDWHRFGNDDERQVCVSLLAHSFAGNRYSLTRSTLSVIGWFPRPIRTTRSFAEPLSRSFNNIGQKVIDPNNESDWRSCKLDLSGADLASSGVWTQNLAGVVLNGAELGGVFFFTADLVGAQMLSAELRKAEMTGSDLTSATLAFADLTGATMDRAKLTDANLRGATSQKLT
ncbi:pentapeptide repeat-containing protein [Mycobacterium colombiense]|uniref:pentapeptide repeat-containing protein n=1 Tax=Mycobacterium colombiense TaxID=339268 RepID=UPI0012DB0BA5|nr:pentapeptide repeat-containing protein [Mycobacterium colombiense]